MKEKLILFLDNDISSLLSTKISVEKLQIPKTKIFVGNDDTIEK